MPKFSDDTCDHTGKKYEKLGVVGLFIVRNGEKVFRFYDECSEEMIDVPMSLIDKLREDEWAYDSSCHNVLKEKVK
jgi:hypothetical protein